jgi:ferredoxin/pSer/pThr/pTyr-binding forkhead associated (FHA) protein
MEIGRQAPILAFPNDPHMADLHASVIKEGDDFWLSPLASGAGAWQRVLDPDGVPLQQGDQIWIGSQLLQVLQANKGWVVRHFDSQGVQQQDHPISDSVLVGRAEAISLDPADTMLSRRHCQLRREENGELRLYDRGASNGTFLMIRDRLSLGGGVEFRVGSSDFRFEAGGAQPADVSGEVLLHAPPAESIEAEAIRESTAISGDGFAVTIEEDDVVREFSVAPDQSVLDGYIAAGHPQYEPLGWECKKGACGQCAIAIVDGGDNFEPIDPSGNELKTIKVTVGGDAEPDEVRLACVARIKGPVKVSLPE